MPKDKNTKFTTDMVIAHLAASLPDGDDELSQDASDAAAMLEEIRGYFYNTPVEAILTEAIVVCDAVSQAATPE